MFNIHNNFELPIWKCKYVILQGKVRAALSTFKCHQNM